MKLLSTIQAVVAFAMSCLVATPAFADVWDGTSTQPTQGDGTEGNPYVITTAQQFANIRSNAGACYVLATDVDLNGLDWQPQDFQGTLDGAGHTVSGLHGVRYGLFNTLRGTVKSLTISGATVALGGDGQSFNWDDKSCGILAQRAENATIVGVHVSNSAITIAPDFEFGQWGCKYGIGALVGQANGTTKVDCCSAQGVVITAGAATLTNGCYLAVGGLAGYVANTATVGNSAVAGANISLASLTNTAASQVFAVGGVVGALQDGTHLPTNVRATGTVNAPAAWAGPVVGIFQYDQNNQEQNWRGGNVAADQQAAYATWAQNVTLGASATQGNPQGIAACTEADVQQFIAASIPNSGTITDRDATRRGTTPHTIAATFVKTDGLTLAWTVDGAAVAAATDGTISVAPSFAATRDIVCTASDGTVARLTLPRALLATLTGTGDGRGTQRNPFVINNEEELREWARLSNAPVGERTAEGDNAEVYNTACFQLADNITLTGGDFQPVCAITSMDRYSDTYVFRGSFDGLGHSITGLRLMWGGQDIHRGWDESLQYYTEGWGLFGVVAGTVQNVIIKDAQLRHNPQHTSNHVVGGDANNKMVDNCVGVLAGVAVSGARLHNIDVQGTIYDTNGGDYAIGHGTGDDGWLSRYLCLGGIVGRVQSAYNEMNGITSGVALDHLSASVDFDIQHAQFTATGLVRQGIMCNIGGIVGQLRTAGDLSGLPVLTKTFYTGQTRVWSGAFVAPAVGFTMTGATVKADDGDLAQYCKWYTQAPTAQAYYNNYKVWNGSAYTSAFPAVCDNDAATVAAHQHGSQPAAYSMQGAPANAVATADPNVIADFIDGSDIFWGWDAQQQRVVLNSGDAKYLRVDVAQDGHTLTATLNGVTAPATYQWYCNGQPITGAQTATYVAPTQPRDQRIHCQATVSPTERYVSADKLIAGTLGAIGATLANSADGDATATLTVTVTPAALATTQGFTTTYAWTKAGSTASLGTDNTLNVTEQGTYSCLVTVQDGGETVFTTTLVAGVGERNVYLCPDAWSGKTGDDANNGGDEDHAVKTWARAYQLLTDGDTWDHNRIILMGTSPVAATKAGFSLTKNNTMADDGNINSHYLTADEWEAARGLMHRNVTITGNYGKDYSAVIEMPNSQKANGGDAIFALNGATRFEHLTFKGQSQSVTDGKFTILACQYNDLEMGAGIVCTGFPIASVSQEDVGPLPGSRVPDFQIFGGFNNDGRYAADPKATPAYDFSITLRSGYFGPVCVGGRQADDGGYTPTAGLTGTMGTPTHPIRCTVTVDIDQEWNKAHAITFTGYGSSDYDIGTLLAGNHEGTIYADVTLDIVRGRLSRVVGGILGGRRHVEHAVEGATTNVSYPTDSYYGRVRTMIHPVQDSDVLITELYGGGLGRKWGDGSEAVMTTFYGLNHTTISGGTFDVSPDFANYAEKDRAAIYAGIYGSGAGAMLGIGNATLHTNDPALPYWITDNTGNVAYTTVEDYLAKSGAQKVYVACADTIIDPRDTRAVINIAGGTFGAGLRGIFGGGNGFVNTRLIDPTRATPNVLAGSLFGKNEDAVVATLNISGGTFHCPVFGGSKGNNYYYTNPGKNTAADYAANAQILGSTAVNITGGTFHANVYGGGSGEDGDAFADMARVYGSTKVNITGAAVLLADVFAGGQNAYTKNTATVILDNAAAMVFGDIYGGGELANVGQNTYVGLRNGYYGSEIYGGGKGTTAKAANVAGYTQVYVNGGHVLWNMLWDPAAGDYVTWDGTPTGDNAARFIGGTADAPQWLNAHNIYGGANVNGSVGGQAVVEVTRGATPMALINTEAWQKSFYDNAQPHYYVFGGGNGQLTTVGSTKVKVGVLEAIVGGGTTDQQLARPAVAGDVAGDVASQPHAGDVAFQPRAGHVGFRPRASLAHDDSARGKNATSRAAAARSDVDFNIYDNSFGIPDYTVLGVLGGGNLGRVLGNTSVSVGGETFIHRVYGGGYGMASATEYSQVAQSTLGEVAGTAYVTADGGYIYGDIFGGGAHGNVLTAASANVTGRAQVYGSVYGGGDIARVGNDTPAGANDNTTTTAQPATTYTTTLTVGGGAVYDRAFGAGSHGPVLGAAHVAVATTTYTPYIYGDLYGGGELAEVTDSTTVDISGGKLGGNIFGGGLGSETTAANIGRTTTINITGGELLWNEKADAYGNITRFSNAVQINTTDAWSKPVKDIERMDVVDGFFDRETNRFVSDHNIYGGGNVNCAVAGRATVNMRRGMLYGMQEYLDGGTLTPFTLCYYAMARTPGRTQFSVFGGGYGAKTSVGSTDVLFNVAEDDISLDFERRLQRTGQGVPAGERDFRYGGSIGNFDRRYRASRLSWAGGVDGHYTIDIIGGGYAGTVAGDTRVTLANTVEARHIYGGGMGALLPGSTSASTYGAVGGSTAVSIKGGVVSGNVYGGGAGVESTTATDGTITDYPQMARVAGKTTVNIANIDREIDGNLIDGTLVYGSIFGGGDVANVGTSEATADNDDYTAEVHVKGGAIFAPVFGGGNGRPATATAHYDQLGTVYGNTLLDISAPNAAEKEKNNPRLWNRAYGGGQYGTVRGSATLRISGGHFGYNILGGGFGSVVEKDGQQVKTDAYITGNTHVAISGGQWRIAQIWQTTDAQGKQTRSWAPVNIYQGRVYSSQYNPENRSFLINHNIYGGGNICSTIRGNANVTITRGMLPDDADLGRSYSGSLFEQPEWKEVYEKIGSAHFSVFGGGFGPHTLVMGDTHVSLDIEGSVVPTAQEHALERAKRFHSYQSLLNVIGGGFNGTVSGNANVTIGGNAFLRRVYGGGYYAPVSNTTVLVASGDMDDVFGGGLMGDVLHTATTTLGDAAQGATALYVNADVYGGNDVSGSVGIQTADDGTETHTAGEGTTVNIYGGRVYGNVYGAANGNYLYALGKQGEQSVTVNEHYLRTDAFAGYDLVYTVPMRRGMVSSTAAGPAQTIVNINTYRPVTIKSELNIAGRGGQTVQVDGNVYGGGNSASVYAVEFQDQCQAAINLGSNIRLGGVYLGSDGEALFTADKDNQFLDNYQALNDVDLADTVRWLADPAAMAIREKYLPVKNADRTTVYPHLLDLYFQPVEMCFQPTVTFASDLQNATIGTFCCGGNRGNMNVYPDQNGNAVNITLPAGLTITEKVVGGCNNANFVWHGAGATVTKHTGGYLLGQRGTMNDDTGRALIDLKVRCQFQPREENGHYVHGNVYGACYESGTVNGDIALDVTSDMMHGLDAAKVKAADDANVTTATVFGAGYGSESYVYGNIRLHFGRGAKATNTPARQQQNVAAGSARRSEATAELRNMREALPATLAQQTTYTGPSANFIFGGGEKGHVIGNTRVHILNGHINNSVTGSSYSSEHWGSTEVFVGYPDKYTCTRQGIYQLDRADHAQDNLALRDTDPISGEQYNTIKQEVYLMQGDRVSATVYDAIVARDASRANCFTKAPDEQPADWDDIDIKIGESVYGGGYALQTHDSFLPDQYALLRYDAAHNIDAAGSSQTSIGFGGNTTVLVWDQPTAASTKDHIQISSPDPDDATGRAWIGGIYGDGRRSLVKGFRAAELQGYGYAESVPCGDVAGSNLTAPRNLNAFQRIDMLRLKDNCLMLKGAKDYASGDANAALYSFIRVGEVQMCSSIDDTKTLTSGTETMTSPKCRNYVGLDNAVLYLGAIKSDVPFTATRHDPQGATTSDTYKAYKQAKIDNVSTVDGHTVVDPNKERNVGTAKNMVAITSGNALKVAGAHTVGPNTTVYYGPIDGVLEMRLIDVNTEVGGGYIYADNIHARTAPDTHTVDFLNTTGNFIFPTGNSSGQRIIDDCLLTNYYDLPASDRADPDHSQQAEMHYWFLEGNTYIYNVTITGYTADSQAAPLTFYSENADTHDPLMRLPGNVDGLKVTNVQWQSQHTDGYDCDIQKQDKAYTLKLAVGNTSKYDAATPWQLEVPRHQDVTTTPLQPADAAATTGDDPKFALAIIDAVDNHGSEYYNQHLAQPDHVKIQLESNSTTAEKATYIINLTINYLLGPEVQGTIRVAGCALPGEMIKIEPDAQLLGDFPTTAAYWRIGKRAKDPQTGKWSFVAGYDQIKQGDAEGQGVFRNTVFTPDHNTYEVPAFYYMTGYGVQYVLETKIGGVPQQFPLAMTDADSLTVHNYHRMHPHNAGATLNLHLPEALVRSQAEAGFAQPRIYLKDEQDLTAFAEFVDTIGAANGPVATQYLDYAGQQRAVPRGGQAAQFYLQANITAPGTYAMPTVPFDGLLHGDGHTVDLTSADAPALLKAIAATGRVYNIGTIGKPIARTGMPHNSFTYAKGKRCVIETPTAQLDNCYDLTNATADDFQAGNVAYNLNKHYLSKRQQVNGTAVAASSDAVIDEYYANGDYRYARTEGENTDVHYLRTNSATGLPNYFRSETFHDTTHPVDAPRYDAAARLYRPLFEQTATGQTSAKANDAYNDYLRFGQNITATPDPTPQAIASALTSGAANRVWRVSGFYGSKQDRGFCFNAAQLTETYAHHPTLTAIDFTCQHDGDTPAYTAGWNDTPEQHIYFPPAADRPIQYYDFSTTPQATQNLLVYTKAGTTENNLTRKYNYADDTPTADIRLHNVVVTSQGYTAQRLHLVDKQNFNAPIAFTATHGWYDRKPDYFVEAQGKGWDAIALPFDVQNATLSEGIQLYRDDRTEAPDGLPLRDITYFYGNAAADGNAATQQGQTQAQANAAEGLTGHHYWLRSLTSVAAATATFQRPALKADGLRAYHPYIVSFPGRRFYEFDMTGQTVTYTAPADAPVAITDDAVPTAATTRDGHTFYATFMNAAEPHAYAIDLNADGDRFTAAAPLIPFRAALAVATQGNGGTQGSQSPQGSLARQTSGAGFQPAQLATGDIMIADAFGDLRLTGEAPDHDPDQGLTTTGLRVWARGNTIIVQSSYTTSLPVYAAQGNLVRVLDVQPGTHTYTGFPQGLYIADGTKVRVR